MISLSSAIFNYLILLQVTVVIACIALVDITHD